MTRRGTACTGRAVHRSRRRAEPLLGWSTLLALAVSLHTRHAAADVQQHLGPATAAGPILQLASPGQAPTSYEKVVTQMAAAGISFANTTPTALRNSSVPRQLQDQEPVVDANGEPDCGDNAAFAALSAQVMQNCCPPAVPGEDEEIASEECELPATCDTTECADAFLPFFDACYTQLSALSPAQFQTFDAFKTGCEVRWPMAISQPV